MWTRQSVQVFRGPVQAENVELVIGPAHLTCKWQPFDAGIGKTLKDRMRIDGLGEWLKVKKSKSLWQSRKKRKGFAAQDKRKLTLQWLGKATSKIHGCQYDGLHNRC